jgi:cytochrome P450 monooxygenase
MTATPDTATDVVPFPARRPGCPFPPPEYAELRAGGAPVRAWMPAGDPVWVITRHADVRAVLTDARVSSNPSREGFPSLGRTGGVPGQDQVPGWFVGMDPPEHTRFRRALVPEFTVRRIRAMRPQIEDVVSRRIDAMLEAGSPLDLVEQFALPIPSLVITALLGVPYADHEFFEDRTRTLVSLTVTDEEREEAGRQLLRYVGRLVGIKRRRPGDDLVSRLIADGAITPQELPGVVMLLLIAGHETTANNIALGVLSLLRQPEWIGDERLAEEMLRLHSVADLVAMRVAVEDLEVGGQTIRAGEGIVPLMAGANHDGEVFECPAAFDPSRSARSHVAFGFGVHQCLGQHLVRAELDIALRMLFERIPSLALDVPAEELPFKYEGALFGLHAMPVRWS